MCQLSIFLPLPLVFQSSFAAPRELKRHVEPRQLIFGVNLGARDIVNGKSRLFHQPIDFLASWAHRVTTPEALQTGTIQDRAAVYKSARNCSGVSPASLAMSPIVNALIGLCRGIGITALPLPMMLQRLGFRPSLATTAGH